MEELIWHFSSDFTKLQPENILKGLYRDDEANYQRAKSELVDLIQLIDDAIVLYIEPIQQAYRQVEQWKTKPSTRAAMAMAASTLDYIVLARHGILLGYFPEVRLLLRGCHERITRCYLFFSDEDSANKFLSGKQIGQSEVNHRLSKVLANKENDKETLYGYLKQSWSFQSKYAHPNLDSFRVRFAGPDEKTFKETVGVNHLWGGLLSLPLGKAAVADFLMTIFLALKVIHVIVYEQTGKWEEEYNRIESECKRYMEEVKAIIPQKGSENK